MEERVSAGIFVCLRDNVSLCCRVKEGEGVGVELEWGHAGQHNPGELERCCSKLLRL